MYIHDRTVSRLSHLTFRSKNLTTNSLCTHSSSLAVFDRRRPRSPVSNASRSPGQSWISEITMAASSRNVTFAGSNRLQTSYTRKAKSKLECYIRSSVCNRRCVLSRREICDFKVYVTVLRSLICSSYVHLYAHIYLLITSRERRHGGIECSV